MRGSRGLTILVVLTILSLKAQAQGQAAVEGPDAKPISRKNLVLIRSVKPVVPAAEPGAPVPIIRYGLWYEDVERIRDTAPEIRKLVPIREFPKTIAHGNRKVEGHVVCTTSEYADIDLLEVARGRFLTRADNDHFENAAILGAEAARLIFPGENEDPVGKAVKIGSDYYTVVGVLKGRTSALAVDPREKNFDSDVFLPLNTSKLRFGDRIVSNLPEKGSVVEETQLSRIIVELDPKTPVDAVKSRIQDALKAVHPKGDYEVSVR